MTDQPLQPEAPPEIREPCPKSWGELIGDEKKRFCSACSLHVLNSAQLTQREAVALVAGASERVCMRIEYGPQGAPRFRDSAPAPDSAARAPRRTGRRLLRRMLSAAAGVLAACHGSLSTPASSAPATGAGDEPPSNLGKVIATDRMGLVAPPTPPPEILGEVALPEPTPAPAPEALPAPDGDARAEPPGSPSRR